MIQIPGRCVAQRLVRTHRIVEPHHTLPPITKFRRFIIRGIHSTAKQSLFSGNSPNEAWKFVAVYRQANQAAKLLSFRCGCWIERIAR